MGWSGKTGHNFSEHLGRLQNNNLRPGQGAGLRTQVEPSGSEATQHGDLIGPNRFPTSARLAHEKTRCCKQFAGYLTWQKPKLLLEPDGGRVRGGVAVLACSFQASVLPIVSGLVS